MTNDLRGLDALIGLAPVGDVAPPLLDGERSGPLGPAARGHVPPYDAPVRPSVDASVAARSPAPAAAPSPGRRTPPASRATRARRTTAVRPPTVAAVTRASAPGAVRPPGPVRPPTRAVGVAAASRPLLSAVSAPTGRRGVEPVTWVVTLIAWLLMVLAAANGFLMIRTRGQIGADLPFAGVVDYGPLVTALATWAGHAMWPTGLSVLGAAGLAAAAVGSRGLRQIGGRAGSLMFVGMLLALAGVAGSLAALLVVALATAVGVAISIAIAAAVIAAIVVVLTAAASG